MKEGEGEGEGEGGRRGNGDLALSSRESKKCIKLVIVKDGTLVIMTGCRHRE